MVNRPQELNSFEFIAVAALRTATAQLEILAGKVLKTPLVAKVSDAAVPPVRDAHGTQEAIPPAAGERS
jgi:hypothetical protein